MKTILTAAAGALALFGTAAAQEGHASIGVQVNEGFDDVGVVGRGGYDFTPTFGLEGEVSYTPVEVFDIDADVLIYGVFAKAQTNVTPRVSVFGRVGYGGVTVDADGFDSETEGGFGYGVGAEFALNQTGGIRTDYTRYDGDGFEEGFFSVSYVFRFGGTQQ